MKRTVLDHGYVEIIEHWGSDERIIEAARMSTGKGFLGWEPGECPVCEGSPAEMPERCPGCDGKGTVRGDKHLLKFLWEKKHASPFEMAGLIVDFTGAGKFIIDLRASDETRALDPKKDLDTQNLELFNAYKMGVKLAREFEV